MLVARWTWIAIVAAALYAPSAAYAALSAKIVVHVTADGADVRQATCRLRSIARRELRISDASGIAEFAGLDPGKYAVQCDVAGFEAATADIEVRNEDAEVRVELRLRRHEIGRVSARPPPVTTVRIVSRAAPLGKISTDLYEAMNRLGGANVLTDAGGSLLGVSLEGRDPRLTQYTFDGARIPEPGALRALDADLLQSAQLDDARTEVDFYTLGPTSYPEYTLRETAGGFGAASTQFGIRGTSGSVGYVVQGTARAQGSPLSNATYLDTSGLTYKHSGALHADGILAKMSAPLNEKFTVTAETLVRGSTMLPVDAYFDGPLPSGAGPGNVVRSSSALSKVQLEGEIGRWQTKVNATAIRTRQMSDYRNRVVGLQPLPYVSDQTLRLDILDASLIDFIEDGKTLNVNLSASRAAVGLDTTSSAFGNAFTSAQRSERSAERAEVVYVRRPTKFAQESLGLTAESRGPGGTALYAEGTASVGANGRRVFGTLGLGGHAVPQGALQAFDDPAAAEYDCNGNAVRAKAPNDVASAVHERHARIGVFLEGRRGSISAQAFDTLDGGVTVSNADTPLAAYPPGALPPNFLAALLSGYAEFGRCGGDAAPQIYLVRDVTGLRVEYRGLELTGSWRPFSAVTLQGAVRVHEALLRSRTEALLGADSPYIVNGQLPAVEPFDVSLTGDYAFGDHRTELIGNVVYKPANNANGLPAYWLLTLGGTHVLSPTSSVTLVATNVLRRYTGAFTSTRYAVALPTVSGGSLLLPAAPLPQPQLFLTFNAKVSRGP
jgi:hypothetical protein